MGVGMCLYAQLVQTKNKQCKSAIILQCYHPHLSDFMQLVTTTVTATDHARVLGVIISSDLNLERHVSNVCSSSKAFFHMRQIRRVRRSLDSVSASTLVHAFVTSRVDYCDAIFAGATKATTDRLQRVLNAAAREVSNTRKFDPGLSNMIHIDLHWLDVPERVTHKLSVMVYHYMHGTALHQSISVICVRHISCGCCFSETIASSSSSSFC